MKKYCSNGSRTSFAILFVSVCFALGVEAAVTGSDKFADRPAITGHSASGVGNNRNASNESNEPDHVMTSDLNNSLWWKWRAPANGLVTIRAEAVGSFRPGISVYHGTEFLTMSRIRSNHSPLVGEPAIVSFFVTVGFEYQIAMDSIGGTGEMSFDLSLNAYNVAPSLPGTDYFMLRHDLRGAAAKGVANNYSYGDESFEPDHSTAPDLNKTVWWEWIAPANGVVSMVLTGEMVRPVISVYIGNSLPLLSRARENTSDQIDRPAIVSFPVELGRAYQIAADTVGGTGNISLDIKLAIDGSAVDGIVGADDFIRRPYLVGSNVRGVVNNYQYSDESGEPDVGVGIADLGNTAWWAWTAPKNGRADIWAKAEGSRVVFSVFNGESFATMSRVTNHNATAINEFAHASFYATAGKTYQIATDTSGGIGNVDMGLLLVDEPVPTRIMNLVGDTTFGNVTVNQTKSQDLTIANSGNSPLNVTKVELPQGFSGNFSGSIAPNSQKKVTIQFRPTAAKTYSGNIVVYSDRTGGTHTKAISGSGVASAALTLNLNSRSHEPTAVSGQAIGVTANIPWTATKSASWITLTGGSSGSGNGTVTYSLSANGTSSSRSGTITVSGGGITRTFTIIQAGTIASSEITSPAPDSTISSSSVTFNWTGVSGASQYFLYVGTSAGANNLYAENRGTSLSATVNGLPLNGDTLYVRIWWYVGGVWHHRDYTYATQRRPAYSDGLASDFDGDGRADIAVYRAADNKFFVIESSKPGLTVRTIEWGLYDSDIPVVRDYNGDGLADPAVFERGGAWHIARSGSGANAGYKGLALGDARHKTVPADYNGDGIADLATFEPWSGVWHFSLSGEGYFGMRFKFPQAGDVPVPADYDGDGITDVAVYNKYTHIWYIEQADGTIREQRWGTYVTDTPVPADYDGDGKADLAVFEENGTWHLARTKDRYAGLKLGEPGDIPVPADYDGDGKVDMAVFEPDTAVWHISQTRDGYRGLRYNYSQGLQPVNPHYPR